MDLENLKMMIKELFIELKKHNLTISAAESITGGKFSSLITEEEGASKFLKGSFICYTNEFKHNVLKIPDILEIVSSEMAKQLSIKSRIISNSDISISFTGNSSADGIEGKEKGLVYIAISNNDNIETKEYKSSKDTRIEIINDVAFAGIKFILEFIKKNY